MAYYKVNGESLTAIADAIRSKTGRFDPITLGQMPAEISNITGGNSEQNLTELYAETTLEGFVYAQMWGAYCYDLGSVSFELKLGETYIVKWDNETYTCKTQDMSAVMTGAVAIGNLTDFGGAGNGEPFAIAYVNGGLVLRADPTDTSTSHKVGIYQQASAVIEGVVYVTFMSEDGTTELYKKPVFIGDHCMNPVEMGWLDAPTKESTAQYNYACAGWATEPNGALNADALKNVTEDRTVYVYFASVLREYTINFYDEGTLLESVTAFYGSMPTMTFTPEKANFALTGWTPELVAVTGDANYYAVWESTLAIIASGDCGDAAKWMLTEDNTLTIYGSGDMATYAIDSTNGSTSPWASKNSKISSVVIKSGITSIGLYAFRNCPTTSLDIANTVTSIGAYAFCSCAGLTSVVIPDSVTSMGAGIFSGCTNLANANFPKGVTTTGNSTFYGCALTSVIIPDHITEISRETFSACSSLNSITLHKGITKIGLAAFSGCSALTKITIPAAVTSIGLRAFKNSGLTSATLEDTEGWYRGSSEGVNTNVLASASLANTATAATWLKTTYADYWWTNT